MENLKRKLTITIEPVFKAHRQDNPFEDPPSHGLDANPFSDPTVQGALGSQVEYQDTGYNVNSPPYPGLESSASLGASTVVNGRSDDTAARLAEIKRREAELEQRERTLGQREDHVKNYGKNNWPPLYVFPPPVNCSHYVGSYVKEVTTSKSRNLNHDVDLGFDTSLVVDRGWEIDSYPVFFHDIDVEIPVEKRADVMTIYRGWLLLVLVLCWNMVTAILLLTSGANAGGADLGSGIFYLPGQPLFSSSQHTP